MTLALLSFAVSKQEVGTTFIFLHSRQMKGKIDGSDEINSNKIEIDSLRGPNSRLLFRVREKNKSRLGKPGKRTAP